MTKIIDGNKNTEEIMKFIEDIKKGKFTSEIPNITQVSYSRLNLSKDDIENDLYNNYFENIILYGISI